jgi:hypothetical protein
MEQNDRTLTRPILEMVTIASEFCNFLEDAANLNQQSFFKSLQGLVPLLYLRGSLLPVIEPEYPEANERYVTEEQYEGLFMSLRELIGDLDEFWFVDHAGSQITETVKGSIAEHLSDVYQDLKDFVMLYKKNALAARENAIASCRELFSDHWGQRLANLLSVVHELQSDVNPESKGDILFED